MSNFDLKKLQNDDRKGGYRQAGEIEHIRNQTEMYLGAKEPVETQEYMWDLKGMYLKDCIVSNAATKVIDEILVNAIDQNTKHGSEIYIEYDPIDHKISIENDKSSVGVFLNDTVEGKPVYNPRLMFGYARTSGNFDKSKNDDNTDTANCTGGVFGIGATATNAFSKEFTVETVDSTNKVKYVLTWSNCMETVGKEYITNSNEDSYTKISVSLNFLDFDMPEPRTLDYLNDKKHVPQKQMLRDFMEIIKMRALHTAVFSSADVYWNDTAIAINSNQKMVNHYLKTKNSSRDISMVETTLSQNNKDWNVILAVSDTGEFMQFSIINGVYSNRGGTHINWLVDQLCAGLKPKYDKLVAKLVKGAGSAKTKGKGKIPANMKKFLYTKAKLKKCILISVVGHMYMPKFSGQRKDEISNPKKNYTNYKFTPQTISDYWNILEPTIRANIFEQTAEKKTKTKRMLKHKKYTPAGLVGSRKKNKGPLSCFIVEGDSAGATIKKGIKSKLSPLDTDHYGIMDSGGVLLNVRKNISVITNPTTGDRIIRRDQAFINNKKVNEVFAILGLDVTETYADIKKVEALPYRHIIIATDQDDDGTGKIRSLITNVFQTMWPNLLNHGFLQFIITPIRRAYDKKGKNPVVSFYSEAIYKEWEAKVPDLSRYKIEYYKGLGGHDNEEIDRMFQNWHEMVYTYFSSSRCEKTCEIFYGKDPSLRKMELSSEVIGTEEDHYTPDRKLSVADHLYTSTKSYQFADIKRHMPDFMDGMLPVRRKILAGARQRFKNNNTKCKVFQLGGYVAEKMNYHHGDASLNSAIIKSAQSFIGAKHMPHLREHGNFGSRAMGGDDAAAARYISTKLNNKLVDLLYPPLDDYILDYVFEDGIRSEPVRYFPIVPPIMEYYKSPATGWACCMYPRSYDQVTGHLKKCIKEGKWMPLQDAQGNSIDFAFEDYDLEHKLVKHKGNMWSIGTYERKGNVITITELPAYKWINTLIHGTSNTKSSAATNIKYTIKKYSCLDDNPHIVRIHDNSTFTKGGIRINITFKPDVIDTIIEEYSVKLSKKSDVISEHPADDPIVRYLNLKQSLKSNINFVGPTGVYEYKTYKGVFRDWFNVRKSGYKKRVKRLSIIISLKIIRLQNMLRFCKEREDYDINGKSAKFQIGIITEHEYQPIDSTLLDTPAHTKIRKLENLILKGPNAKYNYLLKMNSIDFSEESQAKYESEIKKYKKQMRIFEEDPTGSAMWLTELGKLDKVMKTARTKGWAAWDVKRNWG